MTAAAALARDWVRHLPRNFAAELAAALALGESEVQRLLAATATPVSQDAARAALVVARSGGGAYLAGLVDGWLAATTDLPVVRPVWTGPKSGVRGSRLTFAVVADLIAEANEEILLVSFATYPPIDVTAALAAAAERGVSVTLLLERAEDKPGWKGMADPFPDLDATHLCWPLAARHSGAALHAKVLVVDRRVALVGSANLTAHGLERNLECGLLVRGGEVPRLLAEHFLSAEGLVPA